MKTDAEHGAPERVTGATSAFTTNARRAMQANPDYFVWWYTAKSIALVGAIAVASYYAGKSSGMTIAATGGRGRYA